ncbi:MAG: c-type cytochrome biogenesis protein CcsB [Desulfobacterales bacterium]|jgi:cytochrome c-type biogenesis protein CcsB
MKPLISATTLIYLASTVSYLLYLIFQKPNVHRIGLWLLTGGFLFHTMLIVGSGVQSGQLPVKNLHETLMFAGWVLIGVFLGFHFKYQLRILGIFAAPLAFFTMAAAALTPSAPRPEMELFNSIWLVSHVVFIFVGDAFLALACGIGILYLIQERDIKSKRPGFFFRRLPSLEMLDNGGYICIASGFVLLTLGLITGIVYAKTVWGRFWSWDPKEVWSGITWLLYAALIHGRLAVGWRGRKSAAMAIVGFAATVFTFLGVNLLMSGHHGEFTR